MPSSNCLAAYLRLKREWFLYRGKRMIRLAWLPRLGAYCCCRAAAEGADEPGEVAAVAADGVAGLAEGASAERCAVGLLGVDAGRGLVTFRSESITTPARRKLAAHPSTMV